MYLCKLTVRHFRILAAVEFDAARQCNFIRGANGSGKTSILEALHVLGTGRSFRSRDWRVLATRGQQQLLVQGQFHASDASVTVGIERCGRSVRARMDGVDVPSAAVLARTLPLVLISSDSQRLLTDGVGLRRRMIDWAMFYLNADYGELQTRYRRLLRQRNAALRSTYDAEHLAAWEKQLAHTGERIHAIRNQLLADILGLLGDRLAQLMHLTLTIEYIRGWPLAMTLEQALIASRQQDLALGYTGVGPHRADLRIRVAQQEARHVLSRGEAKLFVIALLLAQTESVIQHTQLKPLALIDDLAAELDMNSQRRVLDYLERLGLQSVITGLPDSVIANSSPKSDLQAVFDLEQGQLQKVV